MPLHEVSSAFERDDYILIRDEKAAGTSGGTFTSGSFQTRTLNTEVTDTGNHASLSSNQITLAPGTYRCFIACPAYATERHQAKLRNVTDGTDTIIGTSAYALTGTSAVTHSFIVGQFTITSAKTFEVQHRANTTSTTFGFGVEGNFGVVEVYCVAEFWKVG